MDHYLTTYKKDYLWPNLPKGPGAGGAGGGAEIPKLSDEEVAFYQACMQQTRPADCRCPQYSGGEMPQLPPGKEGGWSRNEIMGPLLDPKLYPAKVGASPETPTSRYNQPNAFLDKLQSKYPMLYSILQNEASPELKQRIDRDRSKTTYQVDYCESGPGAKFDNLQRAADDSGTGPCSQPMRLPGDPCRVAPKMRMTTPKTISKQATGGADPRAKCDQTQFGYRASTPRRSMSARGGGEAGGEEAPEAEEEPTAESRLAEEEEPEAERRRGRVTGMWSDAVITHSSSDAPPAC